MSKEKTQLERIRDFLLAGEILTPLDTRYWNPPIIEVSHRIGDLRDQGYNIETVKRGRATGYYMPDKVDHGTLAAWMAKPMIGGAA